MQETQEKAQSGVVGSADLPVVAQPNRPLLKAGMPITACPTNLDLTSYRGKALAMAAGNPGDIDLPPGGKIVFEAVAYIIFPDTRIERESGEVTEFVRTVLFDRQGKTFRTSSPWAMDRMKAACEMFGADDWANGIKFVIRARKGPRSLGEYHDIRLYLEEGQE